MRALRARHRGTPLERLTSLPLLICLSALPFVACSASAEAQIVFPRAHATVVGRAVVSAGTQISHDRHALRRCMRRHHEQRRRCTRSERQLRHARQRLRSKELELSRIRHHQRLRGGVPTTFGESSSAAPSSTSASPPASATSRPQPSAGGSHAAHGARSASQAEEANATATAEDEEIALLSAEGLAPELTASGNVLSWNAVAGVSRYVLRREASNSETVETIVEGTSSTPAAAPGQTAHYTVRTDVPSSAWSKEVSISYQPSEPPSESASEATGMTIGINAGSALMYELPFIERLKAHTARLEFEIDTPVSEMAPIVEAYAAAGVKPLLLAGFEGRVPSSAEAKNLGKWAAAFGPGGSAWSGRSFPAGSAVTDIEFGNETSYEYQFPESQDTAAGYAERAQTYARRLSEAHAAIEATGVNVGLLAQGDLGNAGSTWITEMFKAVPSLGSLVAGWTIHPYGPNWEARINAMLAALQSAGAPQSIPIWVTEYGLSTDNGECVSENYGWNRCMTYGEAAGTLTSVMTGMRSKYGTRLGGFYVFSAHDLASAGTSSEREDYFGALKMNYEAKGAYTSAVESLLAEDA